MNRFVAILLIGLALTLSCGLACGQTAAGGITTKFEKDASLTPEQVQSVLKLARECGLSEPSEISIGHTRPTNRRLIVVKSKERVSGKRSSYDQIWVNYSAWVPSRKNPKAKQLHDFWGDPPYVMTFEFAEIQYVGKPIKVRMSHELSIATAERILAAIAGRKGRFKDKGDEFMLDMIATAKPNTLSYLKGLDVYSVVFDGDVVARVKLRGTEVVITASSVFFP